MKIKCCEVCEKVKEFFFREWTVEEKVLVILCCLLLGMIRGFMLAPIKKGVSIGSNNGNNSGNYYPEVAEFEEAEMEE